MASHLDLEEQEQLDQLKHFWKTHGTWITWVLIAVLGAYAAWNAWQYWQRQQSSRASALFDQVELALAQQDLGKLERVANDLKSQYGGTTPAHQAALLLARAWVDAGKASAAQPWLAWVSTEAKEPALREVARLRWAALQWENQDPSGALKTLEAAWGPDFAPLAADLRGDILQAQSQTAAAIDAYRQAEKGLSPRHEYRRMVQAKLTALGAEVAP